ncbi:MAG: hypothetical protein DMG79_11235 [Acidobacteria bacterium]|nr:MAG: hypothetical protein DMG79_11235 [Acidobacteriota bacterium]
MVNSEPPATNGRSRDKMVRCPYCVESGEFKVMTDAEGIEGRICGRCGHLAMPSNPLFECRCAKCAGLKVF